MKNAYLLFVLIAFNFTFSFAQSEAKPIIFIYDASGSMWGQIDGGTKKDIASKVLTTTIDNLPEYQKIGLIAYGHRNKSDCNDIEFLIDINNESKSKVKNSVESITPIGRTPLAQSATMAIKSLNENKTEATIILITDGIESCDGEICKVIEKAVANKVKLKFHVVGFGLKDIEKKELKCAAQAGNGNYYDANNAEGLQDVLTEATVETIDKLKENFSVYAVKNGKALDTSVKVIDAETKKELNAARTYRDTARLFLKPGVYDIEIRPLENTDIPPTSIRVEMIADQTLHRDVSFDGGILEVKTTNNGEGWDCLVKMIHSESEKVIATTRTYGKLQKMEVPPGHYKISFSALKIKGKDVSAVVEGFKIESNQTHQLSHDFKSGVAMVGVRKSNGELIDATVNFHDKTSGKNITGGRTYTSAKSNPKRFILTPGTYEVRVVTLGAHKGYKDTFDITVIENEVIEKILTF